VAAVTYDSAAILQDFSRQYHIEYPLLSDPKSENIRAFGLLDPDNGPENRPEYAKRDMAYPGYFWIGADGVVKERFVGDKYFERFTANHVLARMFPELIESSSTVDGPHVKIRTAQTDRDVIVGSRVELVAEVEIPRGVHVYAPSVSTYQGLKLEFEPAGARVRDISYPKANHEVVLPQTEQRLAAYTKSVRVSADVMIAPPKEIQAKLAEGPATASAPMTINARLHYQTCTDTICYPPADVPLQWMVRVHPTNSERAPVGLQEKPD